MHIWENNNNYRISLIELLDITKDINSELMPIEDIPLTLKFDINDIEHNNRIKNADLIYPILLLVDEHNIPLYIIDGYHRTYKAIENKLSFIKVKKIKPNHLPENIKPIFY